MLGVIRRTSYTATDLPIDMYVPLLLRLYGHPLRARQTGARQGKIRRKGTQTTTIIQDV